MVPLYFRRPDLAKRLADALMGKDPFNDAPNGLFLAAPRRTGKSMFLQHDLAPELEARECLVVYVDFWAQPRRDPAHVLMEAIQARIKREQGVTGALVGGVLSKVKLAGVEIDLSRVGQTKGTSIPHVLGLLSEESGRPVALILDEAQHTLTSEAGEAAMFALKSARDQLNAPGNPRLMLVFSGSDRDKLMRLVNSANAPFYGSHIQRMPELDQSYVAHLARNLQAVHPWLHPVDEKLLLAAFVATGRRPQFLTQVLEQVLLGAQTDAATAGQQILKEALQLQLQEGDALRELYLGLNPLEQAVLWRMLDREAGFRPYDAQAKAFYSAITRRRVTTAMAQRALESLRRHDPSVVWKSARGEYAVEDTGMRGWYAQEKARGAWPPKAPR